MEERARAPVSLPQPDPTQAYWQDPPHRLASHRSTPDLPSAAEYVIIGSGISGTSIAYHLLTRSPSSSVILLEARTACSGATGRNGGHTKSASYKSFLSNSSKLGRDEAIRIARLEMANVRATHAFARDNSIDCDSNHCETVDVYYDQEQWRTSAAAARIMNAALEDDGSTEYYKELSPKEVAEKYLCDGSLGGFLYEAGGISAYRFTMGMLELAVSKGLNLQTQTPVTNLTQQENGRWHVKTERGSIDAQNVILATNGYTAHLEPSLQGIIVPLRGQVTAHRPGSGLPRPCLPTTYSFVYSNGYDYMIPTAASSRFPGDIVIGGGWTTLPDEGLSEFGETNDGVTEPQVSKYLHDSTVRYFGKRWGDDDPAGRVRKEWTGIMGASADGLPYVGQVPGKQGLWISASFNGHGMVMCFKCADAVVSMLLGKADEVKGWFPSSFLITAERLKMKFDGRRDMKPPPELLAESA